MIARTDKYKILIEEAKRAAVKDLHIAEIDDVLHIRGTAQHADAKDKLWNIYNQIDPNYLSGDVRLDINVSTAEEGCAGRVVTQESRLNVRKGPGVEQPIVAEVQKDELIRLLSLANDEWWLIRTADGTEGYCYSRYLQPIG